MTQVSVTIDHPGNHEPNAETFSDDFGKALNSALHEQGLKRSADFGSTVVGYTQVSGQGTTYKVDVTGTEPTAAALKEADAAKRTTRKTAEREPVADPATVDQDEPNTGE